MLIQANRKLFRMATTATNPKQRAHELIERISVAQASAVVTLITSMLDPVDRAIANAPFEDEEISEIETRDVAAAKAWLKDHEPIPNEEVLAEFGLTTEDFERMGQTPLEPEPHHPGQ
jgi:hypothetical protein